MATLLMPGEYIPASTSIDIKIVGYGIERRDGHLVAAQPGLYRTSANKQWISVQARRYTPQVGDLVLGVVINKMGDLFKVEIGCADTALISYLAFEGATKRNRPNLKMGDLLYSRVIATSKHIEPELTCVDGEHRSRGLGVIPPDGVVFVVPLHLARRLLSPKSQLLTILGKDFKFEITVGLNGRVWIKSENYKDLIFLKRVILRSEYVHESDVPEHLEKAIRRRDFDKPNQNNPATESAQ